MRRSELANAARCNHYYFMAITPFKLTVDVDSASTLVTLAGPIDETARFPELPSEGIIKVNLSGVSRLTSVGTRAWCMWIQRFREPVDVVLIGCPVIMTKNFTAIKGFLGKRCRVYSFVIPFYSDSISENQNYLATFGKDFNENGDIKIPQIKDSKGQPMVLDVAPTYFSFLKADFSNS